MGDSPDQSLRKALEQKDKIEILLHEYDSLRDEIMQRSNQMFQLIAIGSAALTWLLSQAIDAKALTFTVFSAAVVAVLGWMMRRDINKSASRLRGIEREANERAGEELLRWE